MTTTTVTRRRVASRRVPLPTEPLVNLTVLGTPVLELVVDFAPATQGSHEYKRHYNKKLKNGGTARVPLLVDSAGPKLEAWRNKVAAAVLEVLPRDWVTLDGPLVMDTIVSIPRFASTPKTKRTLPKTAGEGSGDLSKFARATEDGIGSTFPKVDPRQRKVFSDDSRIVTYRRLDKVFVGDVLDPDALRHPGAVIRLWEYPETLLGRLGTMG